MDPANVPTKGFMSSAGNHTKWHQECQQMNVKMVLMMQVHGDIIFPPIFPTSVVLKTFVNSLQISLEMNLLLYVYL